jgi:hypothetical protein
LAAGSVDAVRVALLGRRRDWIRHQGRANAALLLLAREMDGEFLPPASETEFGGVRGRTRGCAFELRVASGTKGRPPALALTLRHYTRQDIRPLDGPGCTIPDLDPAQMREAIEQACHTFATNE